MPSCFRFMTNVWAMFAVVFLAIYTANLAAVMITREEFHEFSGLDDSRVRTFRNQLFFGVAIYLSFSLTFKIFLFQIEPYTGNYNLLLFKFKHIKKSLQSARYSKYYILSLPFFIIHTFNCSTYILQK